MGSSEGASKDSKVVDDDIFGATASETLEIRTALLYAISIPLPACN